MKTNTPIRVLDAWEAGLWVPTYYGDRFKIVRRPAGQKYEWSAEMYDTLEAARAECDRRNGRPLSREE